MFLLLGVLLAIDAIFLIIVTAVPQAILRAQLEETVLTVRYTRRTLFVYIIVFLMCDNIPSKPYKSDKVTNFIVHAHENTIKTIYN